MSIDRSKLLFYSGDPIDKVVYTDSITVTNNGDTTTIPGGYETAKIVSQTIPNPHGKQCFVRYKWSINGMDFNRARDSLLYTYLLNTPGGSSTLQGLQAALSVGTTDSSIIFRTANGYHGDVTGHTDGTTTWVPISQTFTIEYALFEIA